MTKSVAIVGAGIVGATAAYQLSKKGIDVTVFDAGVGQATKAAAGIICPWLSQRRNKDWYQLVSHGAAYYPQLMDQLRADGVSELPYEQVGAYIFKHTEKQLAKVEEMAVERRVDAPMIGEVHALTPEDVACVIPGWSNPDGALYCSGGGRVDGELLVSLLLEQAEKKFLENAYNSLNLSPRSYIRTLKVARTIADIEQSTTVNVTHLAEALSYRCSEFNSREQT